MINKRYQMLIFVVCFLSCQSLNFPTDDILNTRGEMRCRRSCFMDEWQPADSVFDSYYGDITEDINGAEYYPVWFDSIGDRMNGIIFEPENPSAGTVLIIHGYAGNILGFRYIINELLKNNYRVAALSLPGHGLAGGDRGDINNFMDYGILVNDFLNLLKLKNMEPEFAVAHSTGCTSLIIYNEYYGWTFDKVVFIAPLLRSAKWYPSKFVRAISRLFVNFYNTKWSGALAVQVFPLHWFDELVKWNKIFKDYAVSGKDLLIIQGEKDNVVLWKHNIPAIQEKYPNSEVIKYDEGTHTVFMGNTGDGAELTGRILEYLDN